MARWGTFDDESRRQLAGKYSKRHATMVPQGKDLRHPGATEKRSMLLRGARSCGRLQHEALRTHVTIRHHGARRKVAGSLRFPNRRRPPPPFLHPSASILCCSILGVGSTRVFCAAVLSSHTQARCSIKRVIGTKRKHKPQSPVPFPAPGTCEPRRARDKSAMPMRHGARTCDDVVAVGASAVSWSSEP